LIRAHDTRFTAFTGEEEGAERLETAPGTDFFEEFVARVILADCAHGGGCCEESVYFVFFHDAPEGCCVGGADGFTLEEDCCCADEERCVEDVGVSDDPAYIRGAEHDIPWPVDVEEHPDRKVQTHGVAACFAEDTLW
jgi:hypothetical protein